MALVTPVWILTLSSRMLALRNLDLLLAAVCHCPMLCAIDRYFVLRTMLAGILPIACLLNGVSVSGIRKWKRVAPELYIHTYIHIHTHTHTHTNTHHHHHQNQQGHIT
jgi:ABC-type enterobactin transport system permease subunit